MSLLALVFVITAIKTIYSTAIDSQKSQISQRVLDKSSDPEDIAGNSGLAEKKSENSEIYLSPENINWRTDTPLEPLIDFTLPDSQIDTVDLSLDQYLEMIDFTLNDQILEAIEWKRFELLCHLLFGATGYTSQLTGDGADEGVDIRIYAGDTSTVLYLVQCKKWRKNSKIDRPLIQQLRGQMAAENVAKGRYCVTSSFTLPAIEFATNNNIELLDQHTIIQIFNALAADVRRKILSELLEGDYWTPSCATCGEKFKPATTKNGKLVWACNRGPGGHGWNSIGYYEATPITDVR